MRFVQACLVALLIAASLATARTQDRVPATQAQTPIFKGRLDVVRVDVTVIENKSGRPVRGLTERDFTVSENGIRQSISSFADESSDSASTIADDPANRRVFLFVVNAGDYDPYKKHDGIAQFIRERLRPQDLVGVMSLGRVSPMTTDHERIAAIIDRLKRAMPLEYQDLQRSKLQLAKKNDRWGRSVEEERFADNWMEAGSADTGFFRSAEPLLFGSLPQRQNIENMTMPWYVRLALHDSLKVIAGIEYLRASPGDKHIVILTRFGFDPPFYFINEGVGLFLRSPEEDKRFAAFANDAGVAVDVILLQGTRGSSFAVMSSANMAEYSGGQFSSLRIASEQLTRIDEGTRNGYILGYMPSKPEFDGKYRNVNVDVNRKDVTVVFRHGYTAATERPPIDPRVVLTGERLRNAAAAVSDVNDIELKVVASAVPGTTRSVRVDLNIDISKLPLSENAGKWEGDLDLLILCGGRQREVLCRLDQRMILSMSPEKLEQAKASGVPYSTTIAVTGPPSMVKVIVYHFESDRIGVFTKNLK